LKNAGYDSNIYYGAAGEPVQDITFTAGPAFYVYLPIKRKLIFSVYESPQYVYFKETERERNWDNYFRGNVYLVLNRIFASVEIGSSQVKQKWSTEIDLRVLRKEKSVRGSLLWQPATKTSFNLSCRMARYNYGESDLEKLIYAAKLNRDETFLNFTAYREITSRARLFLDTEYGLFDFENPASLKNSKSYAGYGGFEFSPLGKITGRVKVGYKYFDPDWPQRKDYRGIVGDSNISVRLMRAFAVRAFYRRDIQFSVWYDSTYYLEDQYGAGVSVYLSENIRLDYDYNQGRNDYPQELDIPERLHEYDTHSVGIYFRLRKDAAFGIIASRWVRNSNLDWEDDQRDFVGFNLAYNF
jgi:opacity protein-like surface antigen